MYKAISSIIVMIVLITAIPSCQNGSETKPPVSSDTVSKPAASRTATIKRTSIDKGGTGCINAGHGDSKFERR